MKESGAAREWNAPRPAPLVTEGAAGRYPGMPRPGDTIAEKYTVVRRIGEGGMAVVYEAMHIRLQQRLAIKVLRPGMPDFDEVLARFEREAWATAQLRSIHTARIIDVDMLPSGLPYIVMEYLEGADLDASLPVTGTMAVERAVDIVLQVAEAMQEAHSLGIIHRDLKPSNIFLSQAGGRELVKVLDFGISKMVVNADPAISRLTQAGQYFGTPCYAAPEQLRSADEADQRSDIWSLGIVLYELLIGNPPFVGTTTSVIARVMTDVIRPPADVRPDLPAGLSLGVMRALQRNPAERFQSMRELSEALAPFGPAEKLASVAEGQRPRGRLGEILVADGLLTEDSLKRALDEQRVSGKLLGRVLLDMGLVAHADLLTALAKQQGIAMAPTPAETGVERASRQADTVAPSARRAWIAAAISLVLALVVAIASGVAVHAARTTRARAPASAGH
jgi:serine/threonine protein kinase